jgi:hypothetical protein
MARGRTLLARSRARGLIARLGPRRPARRSPSSRAQAAALRAPPGCDPSVDEHTPAAACDRNGGAEMQVQPRSRAEGFHAGLHTFETCVVDTRADSRGSRRPCSGVPAAHREILPAVQSVTLVMRRQTCPPHDTNTEPGGRSVAVDPPLAREEGGAICRRGARESPSRTPNMRTRPRRERAFGGTT